MKNRFARLLFAIAFLGLLSCQQQDRSTGSTSEDIPLALRLVAASGEGIPESDTLRFVLMGAKTKDTLVAWSRHELDLGSVKDGDEITWQAMAWKWDSTRTVRRVVWASQKLSIKARSSGNGQALTLETPVQATKVEAPKFMPEGITIGKGDSVSLSYAESSFRFSFKVSEGVDSVRIDDSLVKGESGVYSRTFTVEPGASLKVKVWIKDSLGSISILSYSLVRASRPAIDSSVTVKFETPEDTTIAYKDSSLSVRVKTTSKVRVDTVRVGTTPLKQDKDDSNLWTGTIEGIDVGKNTLRALAIAGTRRDSVERVVTRREKTDSSISVSFRSPTNNARLSYDESNLQVEVLAVSKFPVESVVVGEYPLSRSGSNDSLWVGLVRGLGVGPNTLKAIASTKSNKDSASIKVTRAQDSTIVATFVSPSGEYVLPYSEANLPVKVKVSTKLSVDLVFVGKDTLQKDGDSIWAGTVKGIKVGDNPLTAMVIAGQKKDSATLTVKRAGDSTISAFFVEPKAAVSLPNSVSVLDVTVKVTSKLNVTSVKIGEVELSKASHDRDSTFWKGEIKDIKVGTDTLKAVATAGAKTDVAKRVVTRRDTIGAPQFNPGAKRNVGTLSVAIDGPDRATVQYSMDSINWDPYTNAVAISKAQTLYARAFIDSVTDTSYASARYVIVAASPTFEPAVRSSVDSVRVAIKSATPDAKIFWSRDSLKWTPYNGPIFFDTIVTLFAKAARSDMDTSAISKTTFRVAASKPTITPKGNNTAAVDSQVVTLATSTKGASIVWSTNNKTWETYDGKVILKANATLYAKAVKSLMDSSETSQETFRVKPAAPKITPDGGTFTDPKSVTLSAASGLTFLWSTTGTNWDVSSDGIVQVPQSGKLYARVWKQGMDTSDVTTANFQIRVATPTLTTGTLEFAGHQVVTFETTTLGAALQWATDTSVKWFNYSMNNGLTLDSSVTLYVRATLNDMLTSDALKVTFTNTELGYPKGNNPRPSAGCGKATGFTTGEYAITVGSLERTYRIRMPAVYDRNKPYRLVFGMHAMGGSAQTIAGPASTTGGNWYNLTELDADNSTIWVAPQGETNGTWAKGAEDHRFFDSLLFKVKQEACIDDSRVFVVGFSFGGMFTHSLARTHQNVLRGVVMYGIVEYNIWSSPTDSIRPLAWMATGGLADRTTPVADMGTTQLGGRSARNRFVGYNGGDPTQSAAEVPAGDKTHLCFDYADVKERFPVKWCTHIGGHMYDPVDGSTSSGGVNSWVPAETWKFITQF